MHDKFCLLRIFLNREIGQKKWLVKMVTLDKIKVGQKATISMFNNNSAKCFSSRFGIEEGQTVTCIAKSGSVIIQKALQEIAIGKNLSKEILINVL